MPHGHEAVFVADDYTEKMETGDGYEEDEESESEEDVGLRKEGKEKGTEASVANSSVAPTEGNSPNE